MLTCVKLFKPRSLPECVVAVEDNVVACSSGERRSDSLIHIVCLGRPDTDMTWAEAHITGCMETANLVRVDKPRSKSTLEIRWGLTDLLFEFIPLSPVQHGP
jgi:hypothetical protein